MGFQKSTKFLDIHPKFAYKDRFQAKNSSEYGEDLYSRYNLKVNKGEKQCF